ncbi:MAG: LysR family transcriptional regulator [Gammaproteobacteria bacterium]|nr:LysR family transcriptional regulator [Gammaproteobacteria bacterium]
MTPKNKRRLIPSTSMLVAFDSSAWTGSFTLAARELNLTQGAVSRQISALEDQLGVELFSRSKKAIQLTDVGKIYAQEIRPALQVIRNASLNAMTNSPGGTLNLAILPTFGTRWLMPRLPSFLSENSNITINFATRTSPFDFHQEDLHAAIHYGTANWPDTDATYLMGEEVVPVCSPGFLQENNIENISDIANATLLHISSRLQAWPDWFDTHNLSCRQGSGMYFEQFSTAAQAAVAGLGIGLLPEFLVESELQRKELVLVFDQPTKSEFGYFLVTPLEYSDYAPVVEFRKWLLSQVNVPRNSVID